MSQHHRSGHQGPADGTPHDDRSGFPSDGQDPNAPRVNPGESADAAHKASEPPVPGAPLAPRHPVGRASAQDTTSDSSIGE